MCREGRLWRQRGRGRSAASPSPPLSTPKSLGSPQSLPGWRGRHGGQLSRGWAAAVSPCCKLSVVLEGRPPGHHRCPAACCQDLCHTQTDPLLLLPCSVLTDPGSASLPPSCPSCPTSPGPLLPPALPLGAPLPGRTPTPSPAAGAPTAPTRSLDGACGSRVAQLQGVDEDLRRLLPGDEGQLERAGAWASVGTSQRGPQAPPAQAWGPAASPGQRRRGGPYLGLIDLQQHRPGSEAAVVEQHVRQDGQLGRGALQGPGLSLQGLLGVGVGSPRDRRAESETERADERKSSRGADTEERDPAAGRAREGDGETGAGKPVVREGPTARPLAPSLAHQPPGRPLAKLGVEEGAGA